MQLFSTSNPVVVGIVLTIPGLAFILFWLYVRRQAARARSWTVVPGRILDSKVVRWEQRDSDGVNEYFKAGVEYQYEVSDKSYIGNRIAFGTAYSTNEKKAREKAASMPAGAPVTVYVDPVRPTEAVLEPKASAANWIWLVVGVALIFFGVGATVFLS